jgi:hypothetical protein
VIRTFSNSSIPQPAIGHLWKVNGLEQAFGQMFGTDEELLSRMAQATEILLTHLSPKPEYISRLRSEDQTTISFLSEDFAQDIKRSFPRFQAHLTTISALCRRIYLQSISPLPKSPGRSPNKSCNSSFITRARSTLINSLSMVMTLFWLIRSAIWKSTKL